MKTFVKAFLLVLALFAGVAFAAEPTTVAEAATAVYATGDTMLKPIGLALLGLAAIAVGYKWAKAAIFG